MRSLFKCLCWTACSLIVAIAACAKGEDKTASHPVVGQVLVQGKPLKMAYVLFYPKDETKITFRPGAYTDAEGRFQVASGAPAGDYVATVTWTGADDEENRDNLPDRLQGRYADPKTSPFKITVKEGKNEFPPFQLK